MNNKNEHDERVRRESLSTHSKEEEKNIYVYTRARVGAVTSPRPVLLT